MFNSFIRVLLWIAFVLITISSIFGFFGHVDWRLDLFSHFRLQYAVLFSLILLFAWPLKAKLLMLLTGIFLSMQLLHFLPFYMPPQSTKSGEGFLLMMSNVKKDNHDYARTIAYVTDMQPDVLILAEVDSGWYEGLAPLRKLYPYEVGEIREDYSGMLMLSKKPLVNPRIEHLGRRGLPTVVAEATVSGKLTTIMGTHPFPPFGARSNDLRNDQLAAIGDYISKQSLPVVLVGDLNSSPFSYPYRMLLERAPLANCAAGFGYQTTWQYQPFLPPLGLSIDQCLHTPGVQVLRSKVGEDVGSDHRPILNWLSF